MHTETRTGDESPNGQTDNACVPSSQPSGVCYMYARILARFWYVICLLVIMTVVAFGALSFLLYERPDFSNPAKGFIPRGTTISSRLASIFNLANDTENQLASTGHFPDAITIPTFNVSGKEEPVLEITPGVQFCYSISHWNDWVLSLVFEEVNGGNVLTPAAIKSVCKAEERLVTSHPLYQSGCLCLGNFTNRDCPSSWSMGNYIAVLSNKTSCQDIVEHDVANAIDAMVLCAPYLHNVTRNELENVSLPDSFPEGCRQHSFAIHTMLFYLLPTEFSRNILEKKTPLESPTVQTFLPLSGWEKDTLKAIYLDNIKKQPNTDGITRMVAVDAYIKIWLFTDLLVADTLIIAAASGVIFILVWVYTGSILVTIAAFLNMVFSLILAYFFFTVVFARHFFPFGNIIAMVLIIGVGADDTFVFVDLWKKNKAEFGEQNLPRLVYETLRHATVTMVVTSLTTASALYIGIISDVIVVKCFAVFAGTAILMNMVLTLTLLPAVIIMQHKLSISCGISYFVQKVPKGMSTVFDNLTKPLKAFNEGFILVLVTKLRLMWIVVFLLLLMGSLIVVFVYPGFNVSTQSNMQFFIASDYLEIFDFDYNRQFSYKRQMHSLELTGCIIWGVHALDNGDHWDPDDFGNLILDDGFQLSQPDEQSWLLDFCQDLKRQTFFKSTNDSHGCFMEVFVSLMQQRVCIHPLTGEDVSPCCNQPDFPYDPSLFSTCLAKFASKGLFPYVFFHKGTSDPAVLKLIFPTTFPKTHAYDANDESWTTINTWTETKLRSAPASLEQGWYLPNGTEILFYDLQQSLKTGTLNSMLIALAVSSVVLYLSIQNILLAVWATLALTSTVMVTVASLVLLGWELDVIEAAIITLAVGLSVDYTIHYGVAYKLAPFNDRRQRTRYSLVTMTPAITMAALSTFLAGSVALQSVVLIFYHFGVFLMLVMTISWLHGTFFFLSLCMVLGPQNKCGDMPGLHCYNGCNQPYSVRE